MTPSNSSVHVLARRPSSIAYAPTRSSNIFRRLFERAPERNSSARNGSANSTRTVERQRSEGTPTSASDPVSGLLNDTVLRLWHEEREGVREDFRQNGAGANGDARARDIALMQTNVCEATEQVSAQARESLPAMPSWKRVLDVALIVLSSPVWLPLMIVLMIAVRLSSPGPVFYRQERIGHYGRRFMIYKFRSMKVDAETTVHEAHLERLMRDSVPMMKLDGAGDPRIVPWGRILRATGLDELPQIFNVLRGEMSLVGPRPCTVHEFSRYAKWQRARVEAAPGLTGYWQVNGKNRTTFNEMIEMDIYYAKHLSLLLDLKILAQTLPALLDQTLQSFGSGRRRREESSFAADANTGREI